jgi:hypothetical protein
METNTQLSYKVLRSKITQGIWQHSGNYIGGTDERITHFYGTKTNEQDEANAAYATLAVNNLHIVAEALELLLDSSNAPDWKIKIAKQALNNIK